MKNLENTLKTQENQPEAMKYHENASGNHDKKKPPTIVRKIQSTEKHRQQWLSSDNCIGSNGKLVTCVLRTWVSHHFQKRPSPSHRHKNLTIAEVPPGSSKNTPDL